MCGVDLFPRKERDHQETRCTTPLGSPSAATIRSRSTAATSPASTRMREVVMLCPTFSLIVACCMIEFSLRVVTCFRTQGHVRLKFCQSSGPVFGRSVYRHKVHGEGSEVEFVAFLSSSYPTVSYNFSTRFLFLREIYADLFGDLLQQCALNGDGRCMPTILFGDRACGACGRLMLTQSSSGMCRTCVDECTPLALCAPP